MFSALRDYLRFANLNWYGQPIIESDEDMSQLEEAFAEHFADIDFGTNTLPATGTLVGLNPVDVLSVYENSIKQSERLIGELETEIARLKNELANTKAVHAAHSAAIKELRNLDRNREPRRDPNRDQPVAAIKTKHKNINGPKG